MEGLEAFYSTIAGSIRCPQDAVVCFVHWGIIRNGWKCLGVGDEAGPGDRCSELLPAGWNANSELYALRYADRAGAGSFLLKAQAVDEDTVVINLINTDTLRDSDVTVRVSQHVADAGRSFERVYRDVEGLAEKVRAQLLAPQEPPKEVPQTPQTQTPSRRATAGGGDNQRFEEDYTYPGEYGVPQPHRGGRIPQPTPQWPSGLWPEVGGGDLDPLNPLGGGMHMDPRGGMPPRFSPYGGIPSSLLPPGSVPPGARFDPYGPLEPEPDHLPPPGPNPRPNRGRFDPPRFGQPRPGPPGPEFS